MNQVRKKLKVILRSQSSLNRFMVLHEYSKVDDLCEKYELLILANKVPIDCFPNNDFSHSMTIIYKRTILTQWLFQLTVLTEWILQSQTQIRSLSSFEFSIQYFQLWPNYSLTISYLMTTLCSVTISHLMPCLSFSRVIQSMLSFIPSWNQFKRAISFLKKVFLAGSFDLQTKHGESNT